MQSILRWSLENSTPLDSTATDHPPVERKDLDPGIIDLILGKPDSEQMKEDMATAVDSSRSDEERISALDHLEMLIENIDNANDMEKLKLWEPLQSLLTAESSAPEIKTQTLWVVGTALQNNPSAQDVYLSYNPLPVLLYFLDPSSSPSTRGKALYALSGLLKHNAPAVEALGKPEVNGWTKLRAALQDPSISVRRKAIFLISSLLLPSSPSISPRTTNQPAPLSALRIEDSSSINPSTAMSSAPSPNILTPDQQPNSPADPIHANSHAAHLHSPSRSSTTTVTLTALKEHDLLESVISAVASPLPHGQDGETAEADADFEEKAIHLLYTYSVTCGGELSASQKGQLKSWIQTQKQKGEQDLLEKWNLSREEYAGLVGKML